MAGEPIVTLVGNATADAELKVFNSGATVCRFTLAVTPRTKGSDGKWENGESTYYRCSVWRDHGENAVETITKGMRLLVLGRVKTRTYTDKNKVERLSIEVDVDEVGPTLRYAAATVRKLTNSRGSTAAPAGSGYDDPWGSAPPGSSTGADDDPPPF